MTHLSKLMPEELQGRNYSEDTTRFYVRLVEDFSLSKISLGSLLTGIADHIEFCYVQVILRRSVARVAIL